MKKTRLLLLVILAVVIALGSVSVASADVAVANIDVARNSNTEGEVYANAVFNDLVDSCSVKIVLQEKYNGSWRTATGVPTSSVTLNKGRTYDIDLFYTFTLVKGKVYRAKAVYTDTVYSLTYTNTYYSATF